MKLRAPDEDIIVYKCGSVHDMDKSKLTIKDVQ